MAQGMVLVWGDDEADDDLRRGSTSGIVEGRDLGDGWMEVFTDCSVAVECEKCNAETCVGCAGQGGRLLSVIGGYESEPTMCLTCSLDSGGRNAGVMEMARVRWQRSSRTTPAYARYRLGDDNGGVTD